MITDSSIYQLVSGLFFYIFSFITIFAALMVVIARNSVHSVLFLILAFCSTSGLFILIGAEYIAMTLIIVYVGAVAVLFLFVIMMLNVKIEQIKFSFSKNLPIIIALSFVVICDLVFIINNSLEYLKIKDYRDVKTSISNTHAIGQLLYTNYIYHFQIAGLVLFVAMIGSIILTLRNKSIRATKNTTSTSDRNKSNSLKIIKVITGEGIDANIN